ncbi:glycosyltransferase family 2 protein [Streptomyces sp. NPDC021093]|uniref:glycosyltransferase family 2 protein n=1 Tax=Streptomyces sp. NPDC021093 TaxID=3365112 RepID=UPI0037B65FF7
MSSTAMDASRDGRGRTGGNGSASGGRRRGSGHRRRRVASSHAPVLFDTVVVVPARNEEVGILLALDSLAAQSHRPDLVIVVVNNSTDRTEAYAREFALRPESPKTVVLNLPDNPHKKAGALNHAIDWLTHARGGLTSAARFVLVMDADTSLHHEFLLRARNVLLSDPAIGGLSATCLGRTDLWNSTWQRFLTGMQIIEYGRYARSRYRGNIHSMSGAGSFYRAEALMSLLRWRGEVFWEDHANLVEDYETTIALKESGWKVTANQLCIAYTDLMPTLRELIQQRERWGRGTVDTLRRRGWTRHTWFSITTMILGFVGFLYTFAWLGVWLGVTARSGFLFHPAWFSLTGFWSAWAALNVRHLGWKAMVISALMLPGLVFAVVRNYWLVTSVIKSYATRVSSWK